MAKHPQQSPLCVCFGRFWRTRTVCISLQHLTFSQNPQTTSEYTGDSFIQVEAIWSNTAQGHWLILGPMKKMLVITFYEEARTFNGILLVLGCVPISPAINVAVIQNFNTYTVWGHPEQCRCPFPFLHQLCSELKCLLCVHTRRWSFLCDHVLPGWACWHPQWYRAVLPMPMWSVDG